MRGASLAALQKLAGKPSFPQTSIMGKVASTTLRPPCMPFSSARYALLLGSGSVKLGRGVLYALLLGPGGSRMVV